MKVSNNRSDFQEIYVWFRIQESHKNYSITETMNVLISFGTVCLILYKSVETVCLVVFNGVIMTQGTCNWSSPKEKNDPVFCMKKNGKTILKLLKQT